MKSAHYAWLVNVLRLVASSPAVQLRYYPSGVAVTDEIALDYSEAFQQVADLVESEELSLELANALEKIDAEFGGMSSHPESAFWSEEALFQDERWANIRNRALEILKMMNEEYKSPLSDGSVFIF